MRLMTRLCVDDECWVWTGFIRPDGYGFIRLGGRVEQTHVVAMWLRHGAESLAAETVNHLCFNRACCNPDHMQFASRRENALHGNGMAGRHAAKTHCSNGHALAGENIIPFRGGRRCRACSQIRDIARGHRVRAPDPIA